MKILVKKSGEMLPTRRARRETLFLRMAFRAKGSRSWANQHMGSP
jgi:hypothetical protein